jgi:hypothetical protein
MTRPSESPERFRPGLLHVMCPQCGQSMRLVRVDPHAGRRADVSLYQCSCGDAFKLATDR